MMEELGQAPDEGASKPHPGALSSLKDSPCGRAGGAGQTCRLCLNISDERGALHLALGEGPYN